MYEEQTYEAIMERLLARVPDNLDKREGSFIWDAISPIALEMADIYRQLDLILQFTFARTAHGDFLTYRTAESGVQRRPATKAIRKGVFNIDVPIGSRFQGGAVNYTVIERMAQGEFKLEAETTGTIGNEYFGELTPLEYIDGLESAILTDVLIAGENEETDEELYQRYLEEINATRYGGNVDQYREWISSIPGVGRFKIQPLWNGRGTVKAVITDSINNVPSQELVDLVQETLDPRQDGMGTGLVPIGHVFTAVGAVPRVVNVEMTVVFEEGYGPADIQQDVERIIDGYFSEINFISTTVRHAVLLGRLIDLNPVKDILSLTLNDVDGNITLDEEEVAQRGGVIIHAG